MADLNKEKHVVHYDYLIPSLIVPGLPGVGAASVLGSDGIITDNHGNSIRGIGHLLTCNERGQAREYRLTDVQWNNLANTLEPSLIAANEQHRTDNKIPILDNKESPITALCHEMEAAGAPYIVPNLRQQKRAKN